MHKRVSEPLTPELAAKIKLLDRENDLAQHEIAAILKINQGRVSEVLTGKRYPDVQPGA